MRLTADQVLGLAPDSASAAAGRKLASPRTWRGLGRSERALWGECQGSALYQVRVDLSDLGAKCSCPSRKFPCKHSIGLMLLAVDSALAESEEPEWVRDWLERRTGTSAKTEARKEVAPPDPEAREARAEKRFERVRRGFEGLDVWLADLVRNGLAGLEGQPVSFWEAQAARMVDAQAPGVASRLRRLASLPGSAPDWPARLLRELGRLSLLSRAVDRFEEIAPLLREDVRRLLGFTLDQQEVAASGETVSDRWAVLGQRVDDEERIRVQRNWLLGEGTGRRALVLQFAVGEASFPALFAPGSRFEGALAFWPGAWPQRALVQERRDAGEPLRELPPAPGSESLDGFLAGAAEALARVPWMDRFLCVVRGVVPVADADGSQAWRVVDREGGALPLIRGDHWLLLALSGGGPVDLAAEWDGDELMPLGVLAGGAYHPLGRAD
jgi:hypothetical protein